MVYEFDNNQQKYDLIVGIPSFNNAKTIGFVVEQVGLGLKKYFSDYKCAIVNSDGGSTDATREVFEKTQVPESIDKITLGHVVISGKGGATKKIFELMRDCSVIGGMMVDADLRSIDQEWIKLYLTPIIREGYDFITPNYLRHKNDGTITANLAFPLTNALYGGNIQQPIGGDFSFSAKLANRYLEKQVWETDVARFGIDIFMTTVALCEGFKVGQINLGAKRHDPKDPRGLGPMFSQVSGTIFQLMKEYQEIWKKGKRVANIEIDGSIIEADITEIKISTSHLIHEFRRGYKRNRQLYFDFLSQKDFGQLESIYSTNKKEDFSFPLELWVRLVYTFAALYNQSPLSKNELMDALVVLYYGRVASYLRKVKNLDPGELKDYFQTISHEFKAQLPFLFKKWLGISERNREWFQKNTFHYSDFSNIGKLVKLKQQKGLTVGVALPAKNEAETIGLIIRTIKENFQEKNQLIDELIVVDSNSTDDTVGISKSLGVPVYQASEVLPGAAKNNEQWGKGDNLWKSLYLLKSDIICWVDTDIQNFDSRFIYGLVGPLLARDDIGFIKGFYRRPLKVGDALQSSGGGRVTELSVRPLLNIFYPDLSKIIQPLSGEYAGRREIFENIPFCINYALETCMLIDIYTKYGLDVVGQSDLKIRIHRNQSLKSLSKLSFGIMQAVFNRLHIHGKVKLLEEVITQDDKYTFNRIAILESQLPPISQITEYQEKFRDRPVKWQLPKQQ